MHIDTTQFKTITVQTNKIVIFNSKDLEFILHYITLTSLKYFKQHIQMTSHHSNMNVKNKTIE